jgi:hypothetical protein
MAEGERLYLKIANSDPKEFQDGDAFFSSASKSESTQSGEICLY